MPNYFVRESSSGHPLDYFPYCTEEEALQTLYGRWPGWTVVALTRRCQEEWEIWVDIDEEYLHAGDVSLETRR